MNEKDIVLNEKFVLNFWKENNIFDKSISQFKNNKRQFVFYDGPPFANGLPHYGHLLTGYIKDVIARYQTMKGNKVERRFGWDTHGLPVEMEVEKSLGVSGQVSIKKYGIKEFNKECRNSVMKYQNKWEEYVERQGRWVDFKNSYKTMDAKYMESVIWAFKRLYDKGLVYQDFKVVPYSWKCQTPLSNFETKMDNSYRKKESKAVTVKFELKFDDKIKNILNLKDRDNTKVYLLAWTTTPWTLPSNLSLAVNKDMIYTALKNNGSIIIISKDLKNKYSKELEDYQDLTDFSGKYLVNKKYYPLFPYFESQKEAFRILNGDFVNIEEGTGVVHMAPGFGEDDQILCKENNINTICPVDEGGKFTDEIFDIGNFSLKFRQVFETNEDIIKYLKINNKWFKTEQYIHNYPHCWRTDTPLIYKAVSSWYVKVSDIKNKIIKSNQKINWIPGHIKNGQFGKWLEGARDWSITRNRFWGCPVPVWISDKTFNNKHKIKVFGSLKEIEEYFGFLPRDEKDEINLHRPYVDQLVKEITDEDGNKYKMRRIEDVLDCWFESGSMPYAQAHYPFENKNWFEENFPADFITEYIAQTRGWFYTLTILSVALFETHAFKNAICHGTILDTKEQKLSKRLRNYPDPLEIFEKYGSDAMRFFLISQTIMKGQDLKIGKDGKEVKDTLRINIKPMLNTYNFLYLYGKIDNLKIERIKNLEDLKNIDNLMDRYILAKLKMTIMEIDNSLGNYNIQDSCIKFSNFFEILNNWYIRRNRDRFWKKEIDRSKINAYRVLYTVLLSISEAAAPLLPFVTENIWKSITENFNYESLSNI